MFQSPSLRGSGRFSPDLLARLKGEEGFNPLHCGAVVASGRRAGEGRAVHDGFNPLHCGAVVASRSRKERLRTRSRFNPLHCGAVVASGKEDHMMVEVILFQSPSLRGSGRFAQKAEADRDRAQGFNPLHCGAVVASRRRRRRRRRRMAGFNPLHCGAVVASPPLGAYLCGVLPVSIPFIAGQWSLLPRTTPSSLFGVLLRKRRLPCDHIICTRLPF